MNINQLKEIMVNNKISILGSTGEIGKQTLELLNNKKYRISLLACDKNIKVLKSQVIKFNPDAVYINSEICRDKFKKIKFNKKLIILEDSKDLANFCSSKKNNIVLACTSGINSINSVIAGLKNGKKVCIASKEIFMLFGKELMKISKKYQNPIIPVDSEHSGIFQSLNNKDIKNVKKIYITASGGPFYGMSRDQLKKVSVKKALKHPTWKMGKKITIDSATLMNKAIEIVEASIIFGIPSKDIQPVLDRSSKIHSIIEFDDGNYIFSASSNSMKIPINFAINFPNRNKININKNMDIYKKIKIEKINEKNHKAFRICRLAIRKGGSTLAVLNAANNVAVNAYLEQKISFLDILNIVEKVVIKHKPKKKYTLSQIIKIYKETEKLTLNLCN